MKTLKALYGVTDNGFDGRITVKNTIIVLVVIEITLILIKIFA